MEEPIINDKQTYRPLYEKKAVVVSQTGSKINFNISRKQEQAIKSLGLFKSGSSKVEVTLDKDTYLTNEMVKVHVNLDNNECDEAIKKVTVKFFRELNATSVQGVKLTDRTFITKIKAEGVGSKSSAIRVIEVPLESFKFAKESSLQSYRKKKAKFADDLGEFYFNLQPSIKTTLFECRYYIQVSFKHSALALGKTLNQIEIPINVYYLSLSATTTLKNTKEETKTELILNTHETPSIVSASITTASNVEPSNPYQIGNPYNSLYGNNGQTT